MSKCWQRESNDMRVAFAFPSAEYPAICGVPMNTLFNKVRLISGSFSHTSMTASEINPFLRAFNKAFVSITSPREVLMMMGERFSERKNDWSARWKVLYFPSLYKGTWNVFFGSSGYLVFRHHIRYVLPVFASTSLSFFTSDS